MLQSTVEVLQRPEEPAEVKMDTEISPRFSFSWKSKDQWRLRDIMKDCSRLVMGHWVLTPVAESLDNSGDRGAAQGTTEDPFTSGDKPVIHTNFLRPILNQEDRNETPVKKRRLGSKEYHRNSNLLTVDPQLEAENVYNDHSDSIESQFLPSNLLTSAVPETAGNHPGRSVIFGNLPPNTSVNSVVSQVAGGPLVYVKLYNSHTGEEITTRKLSDIADRTYGELEIRFQSPIAAQRFHSHCMALRFRVNGSAILPRAGNHSLRSFQYNDDDFVACEMRSKGARRCITLVRNRNVGDIDSTCFGPRTQYNRISRVGFYDVDIEEIRAQFSQFGVIQTITPIYDHAISISVLFYETIAAINAYRAFYSPPKTPQERDLQRKLSSWDLEYSQDPCERVLLPY